ESQLACRSRVGSHLSQLDSGAGNRGPVAVAAGTVAHVIALSARRKYRCALKYMGTDPRRPAFRVAIVESRDLSGTCPKPGLYTQECAGSGGARAASSRRKQANHRGETSSDAQANRSPQRPFSRPSNTAAPGAH